MLLTKSRFAPAGAERLSRFRQPSAFSPVFRERSDHADRAKPAWVEQHFKFVSAIRDNTGRLCGHEQEVPVPLVERRGGERDRHGQVELSGPPQAELTGLVDVQGHDPEDLRGHPVGPNGRHEHSKSVEQKSVLAKQVRSQDAPKPERLRRARLPCPVECLLDRAGDRPRDTRARRASTQRPATSAWRWRRGRCLRRPGSPDARCLSRRVGAVKVIKCVAQEVRTGLRPIEMMDCHGLVSLLRMGLKASVATTAPSCEDLRGGWRQALGTLAKQRCKVTCEAERGRGAEYDLVGLTVHEPHLNGADVPADEELVPPHKLMVRADPTLNSRPGRGSRPAAASRRAANALT